MLRIVLSLFVLVAVVVSLSFVSTRLWGGKPEEAAAEKPLVFNETMSVAEFGKANNLPPKLLKKVFQLTSQADAQKPITAFKMTEDQLSGKIEQALAIRAEHASKNWAKILTKFLLWLAFLAFVFVAVRRRKITSANRKWLYILSVAIFGVILGSDPSPMGTVKDAIVLLGSKHVIFPPRLIAFSAFLVMVVLANKFICAWGCQFGTLQDAIFRLNRDAKDRKGVLRQVKAPFVVSNVVRVLFFVALIASAFIWATDIVEPIDPFKIFKPKVLGFAGGAFAGLILVLSLFVYRPWCHFFCPFGLVGWLAEKLSVFKIHVDYDKCIACKACAKACPSTVMGAILESDRIVPDCFSCGVCIETCPVEAISFTSGKRKKPPEGKFAKEKSTQQ
jgi:polyferredoxin